MYRHHVTVRQDVSDAGDPVTDYTSPPFVVGLPCEIKDVTGGEDERGRQIEANVNSVMRCHWINGLTPAMRIEHDDKIYEIMSILDRTGDKRTMEIHLSRVD